MSLKLKAVEGNIQTLCNNIMKGLDKPLWKGGKGTEILVNDYRQSLFHVNLWIKN